MSGHVTRSATKLEILKTLIFSTFSTCLRLSNSKTIKDREMKFVHGDMKIFWKLTEISLVDECGALWRIWRIAINVVF